MEIKRVIGYRTHVTWKSPENVRYC